MAYPGGSPAHRVAHPGDQQVRTGIERVKTEETRAKDEAEQHLREGQKKAEEARKQGEDKAEGAKEDAKKESGGLLGWLASAAKDFFEGVKKAISAALEAARKAIQRAIEAAKKLAAEVIERARQAIVQAIQAVGKALIAIGDRLLAAFPELRERYRKTIQKWVDRAVETVNRVATRLRENVQKALDLLGKGLVAGLHLLERGLHAIVDGVSSVVQGAIKLAESALQALGAFMQLAKDIASDPLGWLSKLGDAVVDGIRNHLWKAFKAAVSEWFESKVLGLLGIGGMVLGILQEGGISLGDIGQMAWQALENAIPAALVSVLIEKLVAMIVPAAGAILVILEGLRAAWSTVSRIIAAFQTFFAFLKQVKSGNAGPSFAQALAAAAVVVLDFVANWLLMKLRGAASKVGGKLKGLADRWRKRRKKPTKPSREKKPKGQGQKKKDNQKDKDKANQHRLDKAVGAIQPPLKAMLDRGVGRLRLQARLLYWKVRYRLSSLRLESGGAIVATVNPKKTAGKATPVEIGRALEPILVKVEERFLKHYQSQKKSDPKAKNDDLDDILSIHAMREGEKVSLKAKILIFARNMAMLFRPGAKTYKEISKSALPEHLAQLPPELKDLRLLEAARAKGQPISTKVADALHSQGLATVAEILHGKLAPMATEGSGLAADDDFWKDPTKLPERPPEKQAKVDAARLTRHERIGNIFNRLRQILKRPQKDVLASPDGAQLVELAKKFESWLGAKFSGNKDAEETLKHAERALIAELFFFMKTFNG